MGTTSDSVRRTELTELRAKGVGVRILAEMVGHASTQTDNPTLQMESGAAKLI